MKTEFTERLLQGSTFVEIYDDNAEESFLGYIGEIEEMNDDSLILHEYCTRKQRCRSRILVRIEDISRVQAGGIYESMLIQQMEAKEAE